MDAFDAVADPVRRSIMESLVDGPKSAGDLAVGFAISRPAVSRHLRVLREAGLVSAEVSGRQWVYQLARPGLEAIDDWLEIFRSSPDAGWHQRLDALETEVRRTTRERQRSGSMRHGREATA